jgi:hypothetical protein
MKREEKPLVGDDGKFMTGKKGQTYTGDGTSTLNVLVAGTDATSGGDGMYIITAMGADTFFPEGMKIGELYPATGKEVLAEGDTIQKIDFTEVADCTGWQLQITQAEIDVTRLKDEFKKYRLGKKDATGTVNSIMTLGVSDEPDGMVGRNMKLFRREVKAGSETVTVSVPSGESLYFLGYLNMTDVPGETQAFVFAEIYLYNMNLGGSTGNAQSYDASMRLTGQDPVFYSLDIPSMAA